MSKEMDDLKAAVAEETTVTESVVVLLTDISKRLNDAVASGDTEAIKAVTAEITASKDKLAAAVLANTPAAKVEPPVEPAPAP